jgi:hypothetical protein
MDSSMLIHERTSELNAQALETAGERAYDRAVGRAAGTLLQHVCSQFG